ncbi:MAG: universal stress protein [Planctomycetota bacterium]
MIKLDRIICPTDFSPTSSKAVDYAATMADSFDAELVLLHVIPEMSYPLRSFGMSHSLEHIQEELHEKAKETLQERATEAVKALPKLRVRCVLRDGEAHEATMKCASEESADMIVMGTHGHTGLTHALLGSTAEKVVRLSKCPVLTVRAPS